MEFVYVVPRAKLFESCYPQGLVPFGGELSREETLARVREHGFFVEREVAERTPEWKQVIPYCVVTCSGGPTDLDGTPEAPRVLLMRRLSKGGESRLHDKLSIGVGGHVNPVDHTEGGACTGEATSDSGARRDPLREGTRRELDEELELDGAYTVRPVGILNDDSNAVGAVHVGLVQVVHVSGDVRIRETDVLEGELVRPSDLSNRLAEGADFETWSRILVERLDEVLVDPLGGKTLATTSAPALT